MDSTHHSPLIQTKLKRPLTPADLVPRVALLARLDEWNKRPFILITAPAGYGKSTLLSSWLDSLNDTPTAWLSLESTDDDPAMFLRCVVHAVQTMFPAIGDETIALLANVDAPPARILLTTLVNELNAISEPYILALDDYHLIKDNDIHELMDGLLTHAPSTLHLALASRADPLLPIQKYRAQNVVIEIRANDLRFSMMETAQFLRNSVGQGVDDELTATIYERSEGWVTGLHLVALSMGRSGNGSELSKIFNKDNRFIVEYLMSEVLSSQTELMQEWLLKTAVFDRFCPDLCDALFSTPAPNGKIFINHLTINHLFTITLDGERRWVRYHHLFGAFLKKEAQQRYTADEIGAVHAAGSRWLAQNQYYEEALHHALAAGDMVAAADLVEANVRTLLDLDQWYILEQWLAQLPDDIIQQRPLFLVARAWTAYHEFTLWTIPPLLERIEELLDDEDDKRPLWGEVDFFWGHDAYWRGERNLSLQHLDRALAHIPKAHHLARGDAELFWGLAMQMVGRQTEAVTQIGQWLYYEQNIHFARFSKLMGALIFIHLLSGELTEALLELRRLHKAAVEIGNTYIEAWTLYLMGVVHYRWNEMETAVIHFNKAIQHRYILHHAAATDALTGLALAHQSLGQSEKAEETMADLLNFAWETNNPAYIATARACQAHLSLLRGDIVEASRHMRAVDITTDVGILFYWLEKPRLTECRLLMAQGTEPSLAEADDKLGGLFYLAEYNHNTLKMVSILLLQTAVYQKQGRDDEITAVLNQAVIMASSGGYLRPFIEAGPALNAPLAHLPADEETAPFIKTIQEAMVAQYEKIPSPVNLESELTHREKDVLLLLAAELSNQEIGGKLHISPNTVKRHTAALYRKLGVNNRRQAVAKARQVGLLATNFA